VKLNEEKGFESRLMSHGMMMLMMLMVRRRCFTVNRGGCLIMIITTMLLLLLLWMMLCHCGSIDLHVLKLMLICRHQFHFTIKSVLLGRMLLLLRHNDQLLLLVVLVRVHELRRCIAWHEHYVLSLRLESLSRWSGRRRGLWSGMESLLMWLAGRRSR
jgi:type IV secretory pathway VirB3-like protein